MGHDGLCVIDGPKGEKGPPGLYDGPGPCGPPDRDVTGKLLEPGWTSNPEFCSHEIDRVQIAPGVFRCPKCEEKDHPSASSILEQAVATVAQRAVDYNNPSGERSMKATVEAFNAVTGLNLTTLQGWMFMCCLKLVRGQQSPHKMDSWLDGASYFALAGEEALK